MEEGFGIGFASAGFITREAHVPSVEYLPGVRVAGVQNRTREHAADLAATCRENGVGDPSVYGADAVADMVADPDVDGLWVTSPNFTRVDVVEAAVGAIEDGATLQGIALEKPVARTLAEADRIRELVASVDLPHAYLENWVHEPGLVDLRDLLWERGRGADRPYLARSQAEHSGPHSGWFWDGRKQGGGALTDMLCHALGGNDFLLADPGGRDLKPVAVTADTETLKWTRPDYAAQLREAYGVDYDEHPAEDYARTTVRYEDEDGRPIVSEASGSWCYVGSGVRRTVELLGPEYSGQVLTDDESSSVFFSDEAASGEGWAEKQTATSGRMPLDPAPAVTSGFVAENRDAVRSFRAGENGRFDLADGRRILQLCMAAYRAAETGREIRLADVDLTEYTPPPARE
ncbi:MAG: Gfo/Idh/MocA family protein [Haloarculaceae archaeon]